MRPRSDHAGIQRPHGIQPRLGRRQRVKAANLKFCTGTDGELFSARGFGNVSIPRHRLDNGLMVSPPGAVSLRNNVTHCRDSAVSGSAYHFRLRIESLSEHKEGMITYHRAAPGFCR
jgi:hypothetical protein